MPTYDIVPDLSLQVPAGKAQALRRTVIERRVMSNEWHGAGLQTHDLAEKAHIEAQKERSQALTEDQRRREQQRSQVLKRITNHQAPLLPTSVGVGSGRRASQAAGESAATSKTERQLASEVARLLGRTKRYVSPGGVVNMAQRTTSARLLHLLRFHGIRKDGTRFTEEELDMRREAMKDGELPTEQLPYRTADELRIAPSVLQHLPRTSAAALISARSRSYEQAGPDGPVSARALASHRRLRLAHAASRAEAVSPAKMDQRRARLARRQRRRRVAARARQAALACTAPSSGMPPPPSMLVRALRQEEEDDGMHEVLSEGGISSGDSDDSEVVRVLAAPSTSRHRSAFGVLPGSSHLRGAIAESQARLFRTRASAVAGRQPQQLVLPSHGEDQARCDAGYGSADRDDEDGTRALRAWMSLEGQLAHDAVGPESSPQSDGAAARPGPALRQPPGGQSVPRLWLKGESRARAGRDGATAGAIHGSDALGLDAEQFSFARGTPGSGRGRFATARPVAPSHLTFTGAVPILGARGMVTGPSGVVPTQLDVEEGLSSSLTAPRPGQARRAASERLSGRRPSASWYDADGSSSAGMLGGQTERAISSIRASTSRLSFVPDWLIRSLEDARGFSNLEAAELLAFGTTQAAEDERLRPRSSGTDGSNQDSKSGFDDAAQAPPASVVRFAMAAFEGISGGGIGAAAAAGGRRLRLAPHQSSTAPGTGIATRKKEAPRELSSRSVSPRAPGVVRGAEPMDSDSDVDAELAAVDGSGRAAAAAMLTRGIPTREPSPEPYLPLTDRRPARAPAAVPSLQLEVRRADAREEVEARASAALAAAEQSTHVASGGPSDVDTAGVDPIPRHNRQGKLVRSPLQAAAASDQARRRRQAARTAIHGQNTGKPEDPESGKVPHSDDDDGDTHGAFLEVQGKYFCIPQAVMDAAAKVAVADAEASAKQHAAVAGSQTRPTDGLRWAQPAGDGEAAAGGDAPPAGTGRWTRGGESDVPQAAAQHDRQQLSRSGRPSLRGVPEALGGGRGTQRGSWSRGRRLIAADGNSESAGIGMRGARPSQPSRASTHGPSSARGALGSLAAQTRATWNGWQRAPKRPVLTQGGHGSSLRSARLVARADLDRLAPQLAGKQLDELGAGDLFELARLQGDKGLERLLHAVEAGREMSQAYRASAVHRQLATTSMTDLAEEEIALIRIDAEVSRTVHAELQSVGCRWFSDAVGRLAALQRAEDVTPAQLLVIEQVKAALRRGRQPGRSELRDISGRLNPDEFASAAVQLLLAVIRRLACVPLAEWADIAVTAGQPPPAEAVITARYKDLSG